MHEAVVLIESSGRPGRVGLALDGQIVETAKLDAERKHARDLSGTVIRVMKAKNISARELKGVIVARGPGSFTGLRVGLVTAITLAYVTDAKIVGIPSFQALAEQVNHPEGQVTILADGLRGGTYTQSFRKEADIWMPVEELEVRSRIETNFPMVAMNNRWAGCPEEAVVVKPDLAGLLAVGMPRLAKGENDTIDKLEPLYVQPSSAERQWRHLGRS